MGRYTAGHRAADAHSVGALVGELGTALDHREMAALGERLATAQGAVDAAEEAWLALADEAEALGLDI